MGRYRLHAYCLYFVSWPATMWRPAIVVVRAVCPSVRLFVCLSHANIFKTKWYYYKTRLLDSESTIGFAIGSTVSPFWAEDWKWRILGASGVCRDACRLSGRERARHGDSWLGGAYEIAIGAAVRQHHIEHRGGTAIIMSDNGRYLVKLTLN